MIAVGCKVRVLKGCKAIRVLAHTSARVETITPLGADYSYSVRVSLRFLNGFLAGKVVSLYARHVNRLADPIVNLNDGNPTHTVQIGAY